MACKCSQLGQVPLPGRTIPYHFTNDEIKAFLERHRGDMALSEYLFKKQPPYGVIIYEDYGEILVWYDASGTLHVVDITNMRLVGEIEKAPFQSDPQYLALLNSQIDKVISTVGVASLGTAVIALILGVVWLTSK